MKQCAIDGCEKPLLARGWCGMHYHRWERYGDPLAGSTFRGEKQKYYETVVLAYDGDDCLIWPYQRGAYGYGSINIPGVGTRYVHRLACEAINGPPPSSAHEAAHNCGNGAGGCCNPKHLRWATRTENQRDRVGHGTSNRGSKHGMSKLDEFTVPQILAARGTESQRKIGARFGVSQAAVSMIFSGERWAWLHADNDNVPAAASSHHSLTAHQADLTKRR